MYIEPPFPKNTSSVNIYKCFFVLNGKTQRIIIIQIIKMQPNNQNNLLNANTTITIQSLSPKQIVGECIDLATCLFKQLVQHYLQNNKLENPFGQKIDFSALCNYILEPSRLDNILEQYVKSNDKSMKGLTRSWLFQLRNLRNMWAHSDILNYRLAVRSFDTLSLVFQAFEGNAQTELFQKIQFYRRSLVITQAKSYVS